MLAGTSHATVFDGTCGDASLASPGCWTAGEPNIATIGVFNDPLVDTGFLNGVTRHWKGADVTLDANIGWRLTWPAELTLEPAIPGQTGGLRIGVADNDICDLYLISDGGWGYVRVGPSPSIDQDTVIGLVAGSTGYLSVGPFIQLTTDDVYVGKAGTGTLNILGGSVSSANVYLGEQPGSQGSAGAGLLNGGEWTIDGSIAIGLEGEGTLTIDNGATVSTNDTGTTHIAYESGSAGTVTVDGVGSNWTLAGGLDLGRGGAGLLEIRNGGTVVTESLQPLTHGTVTLAGGLLDSGGIDGSWPGATFDFTGGTLMTNYFEGALVSQGGTLSPGRSVGRMGVTGSYTEDTNSILRVEIAGLTAGAATDGYDFVDITQSASLGGQLQIELLGGFAPELDNTFDILLAETITGVFGSESLPPLGPGLEWDLQYLVDEIGTRDVVRLKVLAAPAGVPALSPTTLGLLVAAILATGIGTIQRRRQHAMPGNG